MALPPCSAGPALPCQWFADAGERLPRPERHPDLLRGPPPMPGRLCTGCGRRVGPRAATGKPSFRQGVLYPPAASSVKLKRPHLGGAGDVVPRPHGASTANSAKTVKRAGRPPAIMRAKEVVMRADTEHAYKERILRVLVHIQEHLDEALPLEALARVACFSPHHFHRIFGAMVGESVKEHVRRLRLERAAYRLQFSDQPVTGIALDAGYETHESFIRAFRAMFGTSPSGFRKRQRDQPPAPSGVHYLPD